MSDLLFSSLVPLRPEIEREILAHLEKKALEGELGVAKEKLFKALDQGMFDETLWLLYLELDLLNSEGRGELLESDSVETFSKVAHEVVRRGFKLSSLYVWRWGGASLTLGIYSGEPLDTVRAIRLLSSSFGLGLRNGDLCFDLGRAYLTLFKAYPLLSFVDQALAWFERGEKLDGPFSEKRAAVYREALFTRFSTLPNEIHYQKAKSLFEKEAEKNGGLSDPLFVFQWGQFLVKGGQLKQDGALFARALHLLESLDDRPYFSNQLDLLATKAEALIGLGVEEERVDLIREAKRLLERGIESYPDCARLFLLVGESLFEEATLFQDKGTAQKAVSIYMKGLSADPKNSKLWWGIAKALTLQGDLDGLLKSLEKASYCYAQATEFDEALPSSFYADWGFCLVRIGELVGEKRWIEWAINRFEKAFQIYQSQGAVSPFPSDCLYHLACALDLYGDMTMNPVHYEQALQYLNGVIARDPEHPFARFNLAITLCHLGEATSETEFFERAFEVFENLVEKDDEDDVLFAEWGVALISLTELMDRPEDAERKERLYREAEEKLEKGCRLGSLQAIYHLACLNSLKGDADRSIYFLEKARRLSALPTLEELFHDEWLDKVRETARFKDLVQMIEEKEIEDEDKS